MYTPEQIQEIVDDLTTYIEEREDPTIVGFTSSYRKYSVNKDYISDHREFSELRKRAIEKQEAYLLDGVTKNKLNATMGIFRLKQPQHGFTDKQQQDVRVENVTPILGGNTKDDINDEE
jgi:polyribonucleotide nucleotidyltransferase